MDNRIWLLIVVLVSFSGCSDKAGEARRSLEQRVVNEKTAAQNSFKESSDRASCGNKNGLLKRRIEMPYAPKKRVSFSSKEKGLLVSNIRKNIRTTGSFMPTASQLAEFRQQLNKRMQGIDLQKKSDDYLRECLNVQEENQDLRKVKCFFIKRKHLTF